MKKTIIAGSIGLALSGVSAVSVASNAPERSLFELMNEVQNQCIVRMANDTPSQDVKGKALGLQKKGVAVKNTFKHSIKGMTVKMSCDKAKAKFGDDPSIVSYTPDGIVSIAKGKPGGGGGGGAQTTPWGISRVAGPVNGAGKTAWIIDTGIDLDHADLVVDASRGFSAFTKGRDAGMDDGNGHGTHVAGTVAAIDNSIDVVGVAAGATVVPVKVLDSRGSGSWSGVLGGVDHVAANGNPGDCANMSLGGGFSQDLNDAVISAAQSSGVVFAIAAGNEGQHTNNVSPGSANHARIYTISATDSNDRLASWSNYGMPPVDYAAPGVSILSLRAGGGTTTMSGTSMAAPHACGILLMGNPRVNGYSDSDPTGDTHPIMSL